MPKSSLLKDNKTDKVLLRQGKKGEGASKEFQNEKGDINTDITEVCKKRYNFMLMNLVTKTKWTKIYLTRAVQGK